MTLQFKEIVDLGHEYFNGMLNIGGSMVAFWPLETHEHFSLTRAESCRWKAA